MRLFLFCLLTALGITMLPLTQTNAQLAPVFEGHDASIETSVLPAPINPLESTFVSFGNGIVIQSLLTQPAIFPQENDKVSWGNADATIHSIPKNPFSGPPGHFEQLLAEKFKPILYLHEDEKYAPQEIQVALDTADIIETKFSDSLDKAGPLEPDDLSSRPEDHYKLDLDGDIFIEQSPITGETYKNTVYAHITKDQDAEGQKHIVLQYWFFYYFNDWQGAAFNFDGTHEGDWEFVQLIFESGKTIPQIVEENLVPQEAIYSAHFGGYRLNWNDVEKEGGAPIVYVAQGSHANHFQEGFCDLIAPIVFDPPLGTSTDEAWLNSTPFELINSRPIIDPVDDTEFKWLLFGGKWGEDGPGSPIHQEGGKRWRTPIFWRSTDTLEWNRFYQDHCDIDTDGDGIFDKVDSIKTVESNIFSDGITKGTILERGIERIRIKNIFEGGVLLDIPKTLSTTKLSLGCLSILNLFINPGNLFRGTGECGSASVTVDSGSIDLLTKVNDVDVKTTLNAKQGITLQETENGFSVGALGEEVIIFIINNTYQISVDGNETISLIEGTIDIKSDTSLDEQNPINCSNQNGIIPVAILSTDEFDATTIDHTTVVFEGATETHRIGENKKMTRHEEDVNKDGRLDLMFHFRFGDTSLDCDSISAALIGQTFNGGYVIGSGSATTVGESKLESN